MKQGYAALLLTGAFLIAGMSGCNSNAQSETGGTDSTAQTETAAKAADAATSEKEYIEYTLNLANNKEQEWTYTGDSDAWVLSVVSAVVYPQLPDQQGVSVCVPGAYVTGIDTDGDGIADILSDSYTTAVKGTLVIDYDAEVTSTNGQVYTAATAPVVLNTGAAGYGSSQNSSAQASYAAEGYINIACGNRGKQDTVTDQDGNTYYTGDAPSCLVDQKAAARFVKYNILLGNLPGSIDYFVSTGGSGGGAHAAMFAATSNYPDFYDYQIEAGAVGVYKNEDGSYSTAVSINGTDYELSDGAWGSIAYSAITSLYEADMAMAFEYYLDTGHSFNTPFQAQLAEYLSAEYMEYINSRNLSVKESAIGFDLNGDGSLNDTIALTIEYDRDAYPQTNGYYGTYLDLYLAEFTQNLQWYLDNLDYAQDWTWFNESKTALSDTEVAAMTSADKALAFIEGRYTKGSSGKGMGGPGRGMGGTGGGMGGPGGGMDGPGGGMGAPGGGMDGTGALDGGMGAPGGGMDDTGALDGSMGAPGGGMDDTGALDGSIGAPDGMGGTGAGAGNPGNEMIVGTPDAGTTQSATSKTDSSNYTSYEDMVASYEADITEIYSGDKYGNNIVSLYNPLNYIGAGGVENPVWTRIVMGAAEGDMSMFTSLNLQLAWLSAGVDADIEWQWDGGHVPSEVLGNSFSLYVDQMYGKHVEGAVAIKKPAAAKQAENGTADEASGTDISSWVNHENTTAISFSLADAAAYRTASAGKSTPGFDVIDYGQEDYVFGNTEVDARHWNIYLLNIFNEYADILEPLFNSK